MASRDSRAGARTRRPGPERLPRGQVSEVQRARMLAAAIEVVGESGYGGMSVARVIRQARVSRKTFYELFEDREDCFVAAFEQSLERVQAAVVPAYESEARWLDRIRSGLAALLRLFDEQPALGRLCIVEAMGAGHRALERRTRVVRALIAAVDEGRLGAGGAPRPKQPPPLTAEGVVGAVLSVIYARLGPPGTRPPEPLGGLLGPLMGMIALPYLGAAAAERELERPAPPLVRQEIQTPTTGDPLGGVQMRLTYRTLRVLAAIAANPGASNRGIADAAGISDQGQVSKLLARLTGLGLLANTGNGSAKGAPNAWALTEKGREVVEGIQAGRGER